MKFQKKSIKIPDFLKHISNFAPIYREANVFLPTLTHHRISMAGLYIHIPFCASRCIYCAFYSSTRLELRQRYVDALCAEMDRRKGYLPEEQPIKTIYLGGGTPSQLTKGQFEQLFAYIYKVYGQAAEEITVEMNPDDIQPGNIAALAALGVNRISMGAQTFSEERLKFLRRRHRAGDIVRAVQTVNSQGIGNVSIDLMFGFPGQKLTEWQSDLERVLEIRPQHISAYGLMYEEGTTLMHMLEQGKVQPADEELCNAMYDRLMDMLEAAGYEHYEISNFALPGYRARHNSCYWDDTPYTGIGAAAHSYDGRSRQWNVADLETYIRGTERGENVIEREEIDEQTHYNDIITTALRTIEGIDTEKLDHTQRQHLLTCARQHIGSGNLMMEGSRIRLTRKGLYISDMVMSDLMMID